MTPEADPAQEAKQDSKRGLRVLARVGFAAAGLIHLLLGYLAIRVATHHGGESDQSGALAQIAKLPGGTVVLWVTVIGLFALGAWLLVQAALGVGSRAKKKWMRRVSAVAKAVPYIVLGVTAAKTAVGAHTSSAGSSEHASSTLLSVPGGRILLVIVGLVAIGVGVYFVVKGIRQKFRDDLVVPPGDRGKVVVVAGIVGFIAKGVAIVVVGILFAVAAITSDPQKASGLDGALKSLAGLPFGRVILLAVGVGLACYGVYCFARGRYARLDA